MIINHNTSALNTLNALNKNNKNSASAMEKLSSGLRINNASDDSAGLAISEKMRAQIRGLQQAQRNTQDGISLIQTAESGLGIIQDPNLLRLRELAVQSANDTLTDEDRKAIQKEVQQIKEGINEIANNTEFNNIKLLNREPIQTTTSNAVESVLAGFNWSEVNSGTTEILDSVIYAGNQFVALGRNGTIITSFDGESWNSQNSGTTSDLKSIDWNGNKYIAGTSTGDVLESSDGVAWTVRTTGVTGGTINSMVWNGSKFVGAGAGNNSFPDTLTSIDGITWSTHNNTDLAAVEDIAWDQGKFVAVQGGGYISTSTDGITWTRQSSPVSGPVNRLYGIASDGSQFVAVGDSGNIVTSLDGENWTTQSSGVSNDLKDVSWNGSHFVAVGNNEILISEDGSAWTDAYNGSNWLEDVSWGNDKFVAVGVNGKIMTSSASTGTNPSSITSLPSLSFQIGANSGDTFLVELIDARTTALGIDGIDLSTRQGAESAISKLDQAMEIVSSERGKFGAYQNRLEHSLSNASNYEMNLIASESRIRDADIAKQTMEMTKNQILSQASQAMLSQANQNPKQIMQLISG